MYLYSLAILKSNNEDKAVYFPVAASIQKY